MMGIAKGMQTLVALAGCPVVMHQYAHELGQQAERIQGLGPAFGMR